MNFKFFITRSVPQTVVQCAKLEIERSKAIYMSAMHRNTILINAG